MEGSCRTISGGHHVASVLSGQGEAPSLDRPPPQVADWLGMSGSMSGGPMLCSSAPPGVQGSGWQGLRRGLDPEAGSMNPGGARADRSELVLGQAGVWGLTPALWRPLGGLCSPRAMAQVTGASPGEPSQPALHLVASPPQQTRVSMASQAADRHLFILAERIFQEMRSGHNYLVFCLSAGSGKSRGARP